ncbi:hypothetical protein [Spirosoma litoris]
MQNTFDSYTWWHNNLRICWIVLPVLAHILSWLTGMGGIFFFPILVTIAQYLIFKIHPAVARPGFWFLTLPITFYCWMKWGPVITYNKSGGIIQGVTAYYMGQLINAFFIGLIIKPGRSDFLINWIWCTALSGIGWITLYWLTTDWIGSPSNEAKSSSLFIVYPTIALLANSASSFFLLKE